MITIEAKALEKLKSIKIPEGKSLRLIAAFMGCKGVGYDFGLDSSRDGDIIEDHEGFKLLIDKDSAPLVEGLSIIYVPEHDSIRLQPALEKESGCGDGGCSSGSCGCEER